MWSQNSEELYVLEYFKDYIGAFLDLGSYNGKSLSNTRALAEREWIGVNVEASPKVFEQLVKNYDGFHKIINCNVAVGIETKQAEFYDNDQAVGTLHEHETIRWGASQQFNKITVPCFEINEFLNTLPIKQFDMISIDLEGSDYDVANRMDFEKLGTQLVCIEFNGKNKDAFDYLFGRFGMRLIHSNAENLIYAI